TDERELGQKLSDRAADAASRQIDLADWQSIVFERGRLAIDVKDIAAAERDWNELIDVTIVKSRMPRSTSGRSPGSGRGGPLPATTSQLNLAATISQAAAENRLASVSLR